MKIEQFKETRARELEIGAQSLENIFGNDVNTTPIYNAINELRTSVPRLKNGSTNSDYWGYSIEDFRIPIDTTKHLKPQKIFNKNVELILNMAIIADSKNWNTLNDPLLDLNFNVTIRGLSEDGEHFFCFHIDRHDPSVKTDEPHPIYHLQYSTNPKDDDRFDYGSTFHLDTPRIIHYPLDFILGIGFLTSNFFPDAFDMLMDEGYFLGLYCRYQESFLKPYFHSISNHWKSDGDSINWNSRKICPSLI
jgi:hypothetical protein